MRQAKVQTVGQCRLLQIAHLRAIAKAASRLVAARALGRALLLEPWLSTVVLAGGVLRAEGGPAAQRWLPRIAAGHARLSLAWEEATSHGRPTHVQCRAEAFAEGWRLSGRKLLVAHAQGADAVIVSARTQGGDDDPDGITLFVVDPQSVGVRARHYRTHDGHPASDLGFEGVRLPPDAQVGDTGAALPLLQEALDRAIATEQVKSMACYASAAADEVDAQVRSRAMSAVKVLVGRCGRQASQLAVQLHGAIGLTDECVVSHAFRRLMAIELQFGDVQHHLARYAEAPAEAGA